jgi:hypothetical protein
MACPFSPRVFSVSVDNDAVNLTLLRSPYVAHHDPAPAGLPADSLVCDQGTHVFEIELRTAPDTDVADVACRTREMLAPPLVWDLTG